MNKYGVIINYEYPINSEINVVDLRTKQIFDFTIKQIQTSTYSGLYQQDVLAVTYKGTSIDRPSTKEISLGGMVGEHYKLFNARSDAKAYLIDIL